MEYEFTPNNESDTVTTKVYHECNGGDDIASLFDSSTYYVVDPGKTKDSCDPVEDFEPKVIIVSSPDECHWGGNSFVATLRAFSCIFPRGPLMNC
jgi:hypothetical protein